MYATMVKHGGCVRSLYQGWSRVVSGRGLYGRRMQEVMAELEECVEEVVWGTQVFTRRWGTNVRDLLAHTPEWCVTHDDILMSATRTILRVLHVSVKPFSITVSRRCEGLCRTHGHQQEFIFE